MGICSSKTVPSVQVPAPAPTPKQTPAVSPPTTSTPDRTTPSPSHRPGKTTSARERTKSQGARSSHSRYDNERPEMSSPQILSGGTGPMKRMRSVSMNPNAVQNAPSQTPRRTSRAVSTVGHGTGHKRGVTQSMSSSSSAIAGRQGGRSRLPSVLQSLLLNDFRFRILVVGKRSSGKSSLVKNIFKADMSGSPINVSGRTAEFRPRDNHHLLVHECLAFGLGELQPIRDFITKSNHNSRHASERLHAIWICVPMTDVVNGQFDKGLKLLLDTGVPVVIVFTMFDKIIPKVPSHEYEKAKNTAYTRWERECRTLFGNVRAQIVSTQPSFRDLIVKLVTATDEVIIAHSRNIPAPSEAQRTQPRLSSVPLAWSVSQRASRSIKVQTAVEIGRSKYWRRLWSSDDFRGQTLANCIEVIHADIVGTWNPADKDKYFSGPEFKALISHLVQDLTTSPKHTSDSPPGTGAPWLSNYYGNSKENICLMMGYIVDLILILCGVSGSQGYATPARAPSVINNFSRDLKSTIHNDISNFIRTVPHFEYNDYDVVMGKMIDLISRNSDSPPGEPASDPLQ